MPFPGLNENPACENITTVPFVLTPPLFQRILVPIISSLMTLSVLIFLPLFFYYRSKYARLRKRNGCFVGFSAISGIIIIWIQTTYEIIGRAYEPCDLYIFVQYAMAVTQVFPIWITSISFVAQLRDQRRFREARLQRRGKVAGSSGRFNGIKLSEKEIQRDKYFSSVQEFTLFFSGYYAATRLADWMIAACCCQNNNKKTGTMTITSVIVMEEESKAEAIRMPQNTIPVVGAAVRIRIVEMINFSLLCTYFLGAIIIRMIVDPWYQPENGCSGCLFTIADILFMGIGGGLFVIQSFFIVRSLDSEKDPLGLVEEFKLCLFLPVTFSTFCSILVLLDPGQIMKYHLANWHLLDWTNFFSIFFVRVPYQLYRSRFLLKSENNTNVTLLQILTSPTALPVFEFYLESELCSELLECWTAIISWKKTVYSNGRQQSDAAKLICHTFIGNNSDNQINLSGELSSKVLRTVNNDDTKFIRTDLFDEILKEVAQMLNDSFLRFIKSPIFLRLTEDTDFLKEENAEAASFTSISKYLSHLND